MRPRSDSAQALLEIALCAPIVILLAVGAAAAVQLADARAGLDAATYAAANAAARAPDPVTAVEAAQKRFADVVSGYALRSASLTVSVGAFNRTRHITATATAHAEMGWAAVILPGSMMLRSQVVLRLERWRSHVPLA